MDPGETTDISVEQKNITDEIILSQHSACLQVCSLVIFSYFRYFLRSADTNAPCATTAQRIACPNQALPKD